MPAQFIRDLVEITDLLDTDAIEIQPLSTPTQTLRVTKANFLRSVNDLVDSHLAAYNPHGAMFWKGPWIELTYLANDVVTEDGWLMIANKETTEHAAPQPYGTPVAAYTGDSPTFQVIAKQIISGVRITPAETGYITGYQIYIIAGNSYQVYLVRDSLGAKVIEQLLLFNATVTGWVSFTITPAFIADSQTFDIISTINQPADTPVTSVVPYNYITPNNPQVPLPGEITHANKLTEDLWIHYVDDIGTNHGTYLKALNVGDTISRGTTSWAIQTIMDFPASSYVRFGVAPQVQDAPDGVEDITFETVAATPITYMKDPGYWSTTTYNMQGLEAIDTDYDNATVDDSAYGVDITFQLATISTDWDVMNASSEGSNKASATNTAPLLPAFTNTSDTQFLLANNLPTSDPHVLGAVWIKIQGNNRSLRVSNG